MYESIYQYISQNVRKETLHKMVVAKIYVLAMYAKIQSVYQDSWNSGVLEYVCNKLRSILCTSVLHRSLRFNVPSHLLHNNVPPPPIYFPIGWN